MTLLGPGVDLLYGFAGDDQFMTVDGFVDTVNVLGIDITAVPPQDTDNDSCTGDLADNIYYCENVTRE